MRKYYKIEIEADGFMKYLIKYKRCFLSKWEYVRKPRTNTLARFESLYDVQNKVEEMKHE